MGGIWLNQKCLPLAGFTAKQFKEGSVLEIYDGVFLLVIQS